MKTKECFHIKVTLIKKTPLVLEVMRFANIGHFLPIYSNLKKSINNYWIYKNVPLYHFIHT